MRVKWAVTVFGHLPSRRRKGWGGPEMAEGVPRRGAENAEGMTEAEAEAGMAHMSKVYDGAEGAQAPDANE